jgi:3-deoxy-D-manno-octulosonic-acid transferase
LSNEEKSRWKSELGIRAEDRVIVLGSTHAPEETELLSALDLVWEKFPTLKVLIVPRHPERFSKVAAELKAAGRALLLYSEREKKRGDERVILIDTMGLLRCYQIAGSRSGEALFTR